MGNVMIVKIIVWSVKELQIIALNASMDILSIGINALKSAQRVLL